MAIIKTNLTRLAHLARSVTVDSEDYSVIYIFGEPRAEYGACFEVHIMDVLLLAKHLGFETSTPEIELHGEELLIAETIDEEEAIEFLHDFKPSQILQALDDGACSYTLFPDPSTETGLRVDI